MVRIFIVLFGLSILAQQGAWGESGENYLPNPGFEEGMKFWIPGSEGNGEIALDDTISHSGSHSLRLEYRKHTDSRLGTYLLASNQISAILKPGHVYTFSGWIKIAGVPPGKSGPIAYLCEAHADRGNSPRLLGNTDPAKNNGWVFVSFRYTAPKDAVAHQFRCQCHSTPDGMAGTVWFDDLKLEEGDQPSAFRPDWIDPSELYSQEPQIPGFPLPANFRCSLAIETPHVEIARPYAAGTPRILWAGFYNNARTACELAQRSDLTVDSVALNGSNTDAAEVRVIHQRCIEVFRARLGIEPKLSADRAPQVLVIEQGIVEVLSRQDRVAILDRIRQGMGCVVLLGPIHVPNHPGAVATPKIKELIDAAERLPDPGHGHVFTALNIGQSPAWEKSTLGIETVYSDMLQGIYRSVGRLTTEVTASLQPRQPIAHMPWSASVYGAGAMVRVRVVPDLPAADNAPLMDGHGVAVPREIVADVQVKTDGSAASSTRLTMPPLPGGNYMLVSQTLDDRKRVLGWSLVPFTVASTVEIAKLDTGTASFLPGQPLHVVCTIKNAYPAVPTARIEAQVADRWGRILVRSSTPFSIRQGKTVHDLALTLTHAERCSAQLQVRITAGDLVLAQASAWLSTERLMPEVDFHVGPYDDWYDGWSLLGADMLVGPPRPDLALRPFPWLDLPGAMGPQSTRCDRESLEKAKKYVVSSLMAVSPWTPLGCILHDEQELLGFGSQANPHEVAFFHQYLQETYRDLDSLNASWGTAYKAWDEINAEPTAINFITQSDRNPAPWADWHAASEQAAHRFYAALDEAARKAIPNARIGLSGTRNTSGANGTDWWLLAHDFRSVCLYRGIHDEMYRSFATEHHLMMSWSHLSEALDGPDDCRTRLWRDLFSRCGGTPVFGGRYTNVFFPDFRPKPGIVAYAEELASIRNGFGRLILGARRNDAAAAVFYSPACYRARIVAMKDNEYYRAGDEQNDLLASLSAALGDLRIGSRFVAYEQVARGELDPQSTKVLFLWGALALSTGETAAIRRYLNDGGVVVADSEPGLYDEHCHKRAVGTLHDCLPPEDSDQTIVGKGRFILYRGLDQGYVRTRGYGINGEAAAPATDETWRSLSKFSNMLAQKAGLQPNFRISDNRGQRFAQIVSAADFVDGPARYVACVIDGKYGQTFEARLSVSGPGHLYDCRAGKYLGPAGVRVVTLRAATGNLFALLPYQLERLEVTSPARASLGRPIDVKVVAPAVGGPLARHVIVLQLRRPDGKDLAQHRWIVETDKDNAASQLFLALNDPVGHWTLLARDVATG
ncbi:MAG: carbohydrate binding domain-containing protein, partial [Thermoguttaceae bacterium]